MATDYYTETFLTRRPIAGLVIHSTESPSLPEPWPTLEELRAKYGELGVDGD